MGFKNFPFFDNLAQKTRALKHYKNRGFQQTFFEQNICVTKRPQPPIPSWQTGCIQQPVPITQLEEFLAQDVEQKSPPEEHSTLVQAVARDPAGRAQAGSGKEKEDGTASMEGGNGSPAFACESSATCDGRPTSLQPTTNGGRNASFDRYPSGTVFKFCVSSTTACSIQF